VSVKIYSCLQLQYNSCWYSGVSFFSVC